MRGHQAARCRQAERRRPPSLPASGSMRGLRGGCFAAIGGRATTNIGSQYLLDGVTAAGEIKDDARAAVMAELRRHFRPEFLNRVDEIVPFKPLTQAVPTLMVMKDGQVVARQAGAAPVAAIRTWVEGALQRSVPA